ncbi:hypothetical protein P280DRAFT_477595 [Massarina eburnea CBS 473.64]|uniref:PLAC8-domain-containing protein n=1 Tax=Massarina eburnea CBS 473.64 TaxID=1395130 RepID=A0A6A6S8Z1_9PLEO|nr:hypothetical protein P280DRAFT_477595 [Massarina eburnea CBS 473.64]
MPSHGVIDHEEATQLKNSVDQAVEGKIWHEHNDGAKKWRYKLRTCFKPPILCCEACFVPCVAFGEIHHHVHPIPGKRYELVNTSCIIWCLASCFCVHWVMTAMQLHDIREIFDINGSCLRDILKACCCQPCSMVQATKQLKYEKEKEKEEERKNDTKKRADSSGNGVVDQQYAGEVMVMVPQSTEAPRKLEGQQAGESHVAPSETVSQKQDQASTQVPLQVSLEPDEVLLLQTQTRV